MAGSMSFALYDIKQKLFFSIDIIGLKWAGWISQPPHALFHSCKQWQKSSVVFPKGKCLLLTRCSTEIYTSDKTPQGQCQPKVPLSFHTNGSLGQLWSIDYLAQISMSHAWSAWIWMELSEINWQQRGTEPLISPTWTAYWYQIG